MTGQIPKYGRDFRLESLPWTPHLANRAYVLKRDPEWFIRSDKTSGTWRVYHTNLKLHDTLDEARELAAPVGTPLPTLGLAMARLLEGIDRGFYTITTPPETTNHDHEQKGHRSS
jgi:hypothetical protein